MPTLKFHIANADGEEQMLELEPIDYVLEAIMRVGSEDVGVCMLAFQALDFETERHGAVWIFGTPFFYKYNVGYDTSATPPEVSFGTSGCTLCEAQSSSLLSRTRGRRTLNVPPRL